MKILLTFMLLVLLLILCGPALALTMLFARKNRSAWALPQWICPLQLVTVTILVLLADFAGLRNPMGYTLAILFLTSAAGVIAVAIVNWHRNKKQSTQTLRESP